MTEVAVLAPFLRATRVVDWETPEIAVLASRLAGGRVCPSEVAGAAFEWVRDQVRHTVDHGLDPITCSASEVLKAGTGFCYAKSHLLAALLRANGIPAGFVYQRLAAGQSGVTFALHGLNAVWLPDVGWCRIDARGNRHDLVSEFNPPREVLPFSCHGCWRTAVHRGVGGSLADRSRGLEPTSNAGRTGSQPSGRGRPRYSGQGGNRCSG